MTQSWEGNRVIARLGPVRDRAVKRATYAWLARSQERVPLLEGHLQRSGKASFGNGSGTISYGTRYGWVQHENLDYRHAPGRTAKYITATAEPMKTRTIIANELRRLFR